MAPRLRIGNQKTMYYDYNYRAQAADRSPAVAPGHAPRGKPCNNLGSGPNLGKAPRLPGGLAAAAALTPTMPPRLPGRGRWGRRG